MSIQLGLVSAVAAAALSRCDAQQAYHRDWQQCVDSKNVVVEDRFCDPNQQTASPYYYHWLYASRPYVRGATILDGYLTPRSAVPISLGSTASAAEISRGGFGSSAYGMGSGE